MMRYFEYISAAKVDMLFPQVPGAIRQSVAKKLGINFKILSASIESKKEAFDNLYSRMTAVEEHLRSIGVVGPPTAKTSWIGGELDGHYIDIGEEAVLIVSEQNESQYVVLGGSATHLIGNAIGDMKARYSNLPWLTRRIRMLSEGDHDTPPLLKLPSINEPLSLDKELDAWRFEIKAMARRAASQGMPHRILFLAKRLARSSDLPDSAASNLATPLYIAMAE